MLATTAAGYLDYKLGHPSDRIVDLGLKADVLRASLTDTLPGARKITDAYENTAPGPQYGPLALPAAGAFAGGLLHYRTALPLIGPGIGCISCWQRIARWAESHVTAPLAASAR